VSGPAEFAFEIRPAPWRSGWALVGYAALLAGAATVAYRLRTRMLVARSRELEAKVAAAVAEVEVLTGLIPICSYCKKIRDDQGGWAQLESYLATHSRATFSHGVCPDCKARTLSELEG
ncbi:MAG TPA: hypothetical protein VK188_15890, partial [Holophaga sp.]|nr:hypothetical protein [Holophaga sp.]